MPLIYLDSNNVLNRGTIANDNTGDTLRAAALKINTNFTHIDSATQTLNTTLSRVDSDLTNLIITNARLADNAVDSDVILDNSISGAKIQNDAIALGTKTTGNYVATIAGTTNEIEVAGSGSETAEVTVGLPNDVTVSNDLTVSNDVTITNDLDVGGHAKVNLVSLANSNSVTYDISQGNVARWNRNTSPVDSNNTLTITGTSGGTLDGVGFSIMAFNTDSNRNITFAGGSGITVHYNDSSTISWAGPDKYTLISGLVFDSANVLILNTSLVGSI